MHSRVLQAPERFQRQVGALLILLGLIGFVSQASAAQGRDRDAPLDLAAMALTPADVDDADLIWQGARDYGLFRSMMLDLDGFTFYMGADLAADEDDIRDTLTSAGFLRAYQVLLRPKTVADGDADRVVLSYIIEFEDDDGAAEAFAFLQDESAVDEAEDLDELENLGDDSETTLKTGEDPDSEEPYASLDTTVLLDTLHVGVMLYDFGGTEPDVADAESLTDAMLGRVEAALDAPDWGLSNLVVRLTGDTVSPYVDAYLLQDGAATLLYNDTVDTRELEDISEEMGLTNEYRLWQRLTPSNDEPDDDAVYYLSVLQFEDDDAADIWIEERPGAIEDYDEFEDVEFADDDDVDIGDVAFSYTAVSTSSGIHYHNITFRVGALIVILDLSGPDEVPVSAVMELADAQWACLELRNCQEPLELPEALQDFLDDILDDAR